MHGEGICDYEYGVSLEVSIVYVNLLDRKYDTHCVRPAVEGGGNKRGVLT